MRFPLADWIDSHAGCRFNLGRSGMYGVVRPARPTPAQVRNARELILRQRLARQIGVPADRVFLTHGATEANAWACWFAAHRARSRSPRARVAFPEYPPLFEAARWAGCSLVGLRGGPVDVAVVSQPRNPVGDLWDRHRLAMFARGSRATIVDETFREFTDAPSVQRWELPGLWSTGTFTKVYGGDDIRVGFVVPPEPDREAFARFHGIVSDEIAPYSVAAALATLDARDRILASVRRVFDRNREVWARARPGSPPLAGPTAFDAPVRPDGDSVARRCLRGSVLVCPGSYFGDRTGVRVCLTQRSFARDFAHYRAAVERAT